LNKNQAKLIKLLASKLKEAKAREQFAELMKS
jgi:hypothetical protein